MNLRRLALAVAMSLLIVPLGTPTSRAQAPASRVVAIGDVHGAFEPFVEILQAAGLIDAKRQWAGGRAVLVQTGDVFDRGAGVRDALDLLMRLEDEAKRAGGGVEPLLGNHEVMNLIGDFRDVSAAAFGAFADNRSEDRRKRAFEDYARIVKRRLSKDEPGPNRDEWMKTHPPGFVEYADAMSPRGKYGRWLRTHKVVHTLNRTAFMHAGVRPDTAASLDEVNRTVAREIAAWDETKAALVQARLVPPFATFRETLEAAVAELQRIAAALKTESSPGDHVTREFVERLQALLEIEKWALIAPEGPLWFRGFAQWEDTDEAQVTAVLERYGVQRFVTAHTPMISGRLTSRFNNRVFLIDTGMLSTYFKGGRASALELEDGRATAIYSDTREVIVPSNRAYFLRDAFDGAVAAAAADPSPRY
jgi:hypothetical protein